MNRCGQLEGAGGSDRRSNDGRCLDALTGDHLVLWTISPGAVDVVQWGVHLDQPGGQLGASDHPAATLYVCKLCKLCKQAVSWVLPSVVLLKQFVRFALASVPRSAFLNSNNYVLLVHIRHIGWSFSLVLDLVFWYLMTNPGSGKRLPQKPGAGARGALWHGRVRVRGKR